MFSFIRERHNPVIIFYIQARMPNGPWASSSTQITNAAGHREAGHLVGCHCGNTQGPAPLGKQALTLCLDFVLRDSTCHSKRHSKRHSFYAQGHT